MVVVAPQQRIEPPHLVPHGNGDLDVFIIRVVLVVQPHPVLVDFLANGLSEPPRFSQNTSDGFLS